MLFVGVAMQNIQRAFNATFYRLNMYETDSELKSRHSSFWNLGKLLRECVECFGAEITSSKTGKFYSIIHVESRVAMFHV